MEDYALHSFSSNAEPTLGIVAYDNCEPDQSLPTFRRDLRRDLRVTLLGPGAGTLQYLSNLGIVDTSGAGLDEET